MRAPLRFLPAEPPEAGFHASVYTSSSPDEPVSETVVREAWAAAPPGAERYTIHAGAEAVGLAGMAVPEHDESGVHAARLEADLLPAWRSHMNLGLAFDFIEARAEAAGAEHLVSHAREADDLLVLHLRRRGYGGRQVFEWWEARLQRRAGELAEAAAAAERALEGRRVVALAEAGDEDQPVEVARARDEGLGWVVLGGRGDVLAGAVIAAPPGGNAWLEMLPGDDGRRLAAALEAVELRALAEAAARGLRAVRAEWPHDRTPPPAAASGWQRVPGMIEFHAGVDERRRRRANPRI